MSKIKINKSYKKGSVRNRKIGRSKSRRKSVRNIKTGRYRSKSKHRRKSSKKSSRKSSRKSSKKSSKKYDYGFELISAANPGMDIIYGFLSGIDKYNLSITDKLLLEDYKKYFLHSGEIILSRKYSLKYIQDMNFRRIINDLSGGNPIISLNLTESNGIVNNENISEILEDLPDIIKRLDLSSNGLNTLPESIGHLTKLRYLNLSDNNLTTLPYSIGNLTNLRRLILVINEITTLPETIGELINLDKILLTFNKLETLPESIYRLKNLVTFDIDNNPIPNIKEIYSRFPNINKI